MVQEGVGDLADIVSKQDSSKMVLVVCFRFAWSVCDSVSAVDEMRYEIL